MTETSSTVTNAANTSADATAGETIAVPAPALRLLGAAGAVCVDGTCSFEPTVGADAQ
jgi:hypothetical protein